MCKRLSTFTTAAALPLRIHTHTHRPFLSDLADDPEPKSMTPASSPPPLPPDGGGRVGDARSEDAAHEEALRRLRAHYGEGEESAAQGEEEEEEEGDAGVLQGAVCAPPSRLSSAVARRPRHPHLSLWFLWVADPGWRVLVGAHVENELPACGANAALGRAAATAAGGGGASPPPPQAPQPPPRRPPQQHPRRKSAGVRAARCCGGASGGVPATPRGPAAVCLTPAGVAMHTRRHVLADWGCQFFARFLGVKQAVLRVALKYGRFVEERADGAAEALCPYVRRRRAAAAAADSSDASDNPPPAASRGLDEGSGGVRPLTGLEEYCLGNPQDSCRWISQRAAAEARQRQQNQRAVAKAAAAETAAAAAAAEGFLRATAKAAPSVGRSPVFTGPCAGWLRSRAERHYRTLQGSGQHGGGGGGVGAAVDASLFTVVLHRLYALFFWFSRGRSCRDGFAASAAPETQADFWATAAADSAAMARLGARKLLEVDVRKPFPQVIQARNSSWSAGAGGGAGGGRHVISQSVFVAWYLTWAGVVLTTAENPLECQHLDAFFDTFVLGDVVNSPPPPEAAVAETAATPPQPPSLPPAATGDEPAATSAEAEAEAAEEEETDAETPPPATPPPLPPLLHPGRGSIVVPVCGGEQPQPDAAAAAAASGDCAVAAAEAEAEGAAPHDADAAVVTIISKADAAAEAATAAPVAGPRPPARSQAGGGEPPPDEELDDQARQVCGIVRRTLLRDGAFGAVHTTDDTACVDTAMVRSILRNVSESLDHERAWGRAVQSRVARAACAGGTGCYPPSKARAHTARSRARGLSKRTTSLRHGAGASSSPMAAATAATAAAVALIAGAAAARHAKSHDWLSESWADGEDGAAFCTSLSTSSDGPPPPKAAAAACAAALCAVGAALVAARDGSGVTYGVIKAAVRLKRRTTASHAKKKKEKSPSLGDFFRIYRERLKGSGYTEAAQVLGLSDEGRQQDGAAGDSVGVSVDGQQERRVTIEGEKRDEKFLCVL